MQTMGQSQFAIIPGYEVYMLCKLCSLLYCGQPEMKDHECPIKDYKEVERAPALYLQNLLLYTFPHPPFFTAQVNSSWIFP